MNNTTSKLNLARVYSILLGLMIMIPVLAQQSIDFKGTVLDEYGDPIIGVNITVNGTTDGTTSDIDGNFGLNLKSDAILTLTYIGYDKTVFNVNGKKSATITMKESSIALNEVVAIGYGSQTKKELTGSIASVKAEDFVKGVVANPMGLVQGKVAGLNIIKKGGGDPAQNNYEVQLRGIGSLKGNQEPLYIIDGVAGGDLSSIQPSEIESIDVLKDGSAAAIYGTRANHGVILITTKRGQEGKATIEYNGGVSTSMISNKLRVLNAAEYREHIGGDLGSETDWLDAITRTPLKTYHNVSMSGGTKDFTYRSAISYRFMEGLALKSDFQEINARFAANQKALNNVLEVAYDFNYTSSNKTWVDYSNFNQALQVNPTQPIYADPSSANYEKYNGYYESDAFAGHYWNPVADINNTDSKEKYKVFLGSVRATVNITDYLKFTTFYTLQQQGMWNGKYQSRYSRRVEGKNGVASQSQANNQSQTIENTLQYLNSWGKSNFSAIIGQSYQYNEFSSFNANNSNFPIDGLSYNNLGIGENLKTGNDQLMGMGSSKYSDKLASFFARVVYNYDQKYFLNLSARMEGSSKFGPKADKNLGRWGLFPAISGSWRLSEEGFINDLGIFDDLKLRVGYGVTGNMPTESYLYLMRVGQTGEPLYSNGQFVRPWGATSNINEYIKWEKKAEYNIGIDFAILKNRLRGTVDAYMRNTTDLLWEYDVPVPPYPTGKKWDNYGEMQNKGIEIGLFGDILKNKNYSLSVNLVAAKNVNEVVKITGGEYAENNPGYMNVGFISAGAGETGNYVMRLQQGHPIGNFYGWKYYGINSKGQWVFETPDGGYTTSPLESQKQILGNALPDFTYGFGINASYKNFDLSVNFRGQFGGLIFNESRYFYENKIGGNNVLYSAIDPNNEASKLNDIRRFSDFYLEDATFLKCSDLTLGYNIPTAGKYIKMARVFVNCQNVFTLTKYTGVDPEVSMNGLTPGFDSRSYYPAERSFEFGASFVF